MIIPPIIVVESFDIVIYPSVEAAEASLEAVDVHDGIYAVYDSAGHLLKLFTEKMVGENKFLFLKWHTAYERVVIHENPVVEDHMAELRASLIASLTYWNKEKAAGLVDMPFDQLFSIAIKRYMY